MISRQALFVGIAFGFVAGAYFTGLLQPTPAPAQIAPGSGVTVSGNVTIGNCVKFLSATVIADAGTTC